MKPKLYIQCPKCDSNKATKKGSYNIKRTVAAQRRFLCKNCNYNFTERTPQFNFKIPLWIRQQIIRLSRKNKGYIKKHDPLKKLTYNAREIAKILDIGKTFAYIIIKDGINKI